MSAAGPDPFTDYTSMEHQEARGGEADYRPGDEVLTNVDHNAPHARRHEQQNFLQKVVNCVLPHGGFAASSFNLASATLGASIIALPAAFAGCGIILASFFLIVCFLATVFSVYLLVEAQRKTGLKSFEEMSRYILGKPWDTITVLLMIAFCWGTCVAYVISLGALFKPFQDSSMPSCFQGEWGNRFAVSLAFFCLMYPLSLPKEINSIRYASCFGVCAIFYFIVVMVIHSSTHGLERDHGADLKMVVNDNRAILSLSLIMFAYCCQPNVFEIYSEMIKPSQRKMTMTTFYSMGACTILYILAGFFGYADFGRVVHGAVLEDYHPKRNAAIGVAYFCLVVKLTAAFVLCIFPTRDSVFYLLNWGSYHVVSTKRRIIVCSILSIAALITGLFVPSIQVVFGLLGGLCGSMIGFILPCLYIMYSGEWTVESVGRRDYWLTWILLMLGVCVCVFGTSASIFESFFKKS